MKHARSYPNVIRRWFRPVEHECHRTLREEVALSKRTVITLDGVIKLNHADYRCSSAQPPSPSGILHRCLRLMRIGSRPLKPYFVRRAIN